MIWSKNKKFIFIHIYKTAGTSCTEALLPYARNCEKLIYYNKWYSKLFIKVTNRLGLNQSFTRSFTGFQKHADVKEIIGRMGYENYLNYQSFAFVRNPYDLLVSLYSYILQDPYHFQHEEVKSMNFSEFVKKRIASKPITQFDFLSCEGQLAVNYIGRVENLQSDFHEICKLLNLHDVATLEKKNSSILRKKRPIEDWYDEETSLLVKDYFHKDLSYFKYSLGQYQQSELLVNEMPNSLKIS